ncbi:hypothetical protein [Actinoplanes sp. NPDC020271]|uniref:hypothetical protein n=1 Tax=Actinoplanes sp. NPDC020271 TaxID=3363896 RepID=UPI00378B7F36
MTGAEFHGVDIDLLADYVGGALDGTPESERVAALIADDPAWQEAYEVLAPEMATVGALLGGLPAEPMPDDVATRLDVALGASAAGGERAGGGPGRAAEPTPDKADAVPQIVLDLDERRRKRGNHRWVRLVAPIGIAAGVAGVVGYGLLAAGDSASDSGSSTVAAEGARGPMVVAASPATQASGFDYTLGTLAQERNRITADTQSSPMSQTNLAGGETFGLDRLTAPGALADCLAAIARENAGGTMTVSSIDYARFDGKPALVVRFTASNGEWAWASGVDCGLPGGGADTLGSVPVR